MRKYSILLAVVSLLTIAFCIQRDIIYANDYPGDLRPRVVGARLIEDGISPYFHKWDPSEGTRYYDREDYPPAKASNITATPFFHRLLIPIADYQQVEINNIWLVCEYVMFAIILFITLSFCNNIRHRTLVCIVGLLLLFTEAWKVQLLEGQIYLIIPFFASLFLFFFVRQRKWYNYFLSGLFAACLILMRPNAVIFFLPFMVMAKQIGYKKILVFSFPFIVAACWIGFSKKELQYWKDYSEMLGEFIKGHQGLPVTLRDYKPTPGYEKFEGVDFSKVNEYEEQNHITMHSENGNVFVILRLLFHYQVPYKIITGLSFAFILGLFYFFYRKSKGVLFDKKLIIIISLLGYCMYMISDLSSPVYRHQYYTVQWFLPLLLAFSLFSPSIKKWYFIALVIGIVLNITNIPLIKMQHTIGEYLILITLLVFCFSYGMKLTYEKENIRKKNKLI